MVQKTGIIDSTPAAIFAAVRDDVGPFTKLGCEFRINGHAWMGTAIASPIALYLFKHVERVEHLLSRSQSVQGQLAYRISKLIPIRPETMSTCDANDLPPLIRRQISGGIRFAMKTSQIPVLIVPRSTVSQVRVKFNTILTFSVGTTLSIHAGDDDFDIEVSEKPALANLVDAGWALNAFLSPTCEPVHDTRPWEERRKSRHGKYLTPRWIRLGLWILAVVIIVFLTTFVIWIHFQ